MNRTAIYALLVIVLLAVSPSYATTTVVSDCGSCGFQTWSTANLNENGLPYWDAPSADGLDKSIGHYLTGTGGFAGAPGVPGAINYYGLSIASGGAPANNFYFNTTASAFFSTIAIEVAGLANSNKFGWYEAGNPTNRTQIFAGVDGAGTTKTFTPTTNFGFYIETGDGFFFYTQSSFNNNPSCDTQGYSGCVTLDETQHQHFALFRQTAGTYWIGVEDRSLSSESVTYNGIKRVGDYQDLVLRFSEVPEPSTYALFGVGLLALGAIRRRNKI